ncbi:hypothetical protein EVAR_89007_1 [Eumeta japonica]|uniref:Uncharacterized protein n=1 Tax=Eumeta variegata TaxID=151549 RepID=A0A4C1X811_EUMVA|nr:hypothetical protein EVAR_89007_1 [Eumeta japonica]
MLVVKNEVTRSGVPSEASLSESSGGILRSLHSTNRFPLREISYSLPNGRQRTSDSSGVSSLHGRRDVRERCGLKEDVVTGVEGGVWRWSGLLEKMNESRLTKRIERMRVMERSARVALENPMQTVSGQIKKGLNFKHPKPTSLCEMIDGRQ